MPDSEQLRIDIRKVFRDKNPALSRLIPRFLFSYLSRIIHEDELNRFLETYGDLKDIELVRAGLTYMGITYQVHNRQNIPQDGRYIFVSNHPLGGLDGLVFISEVAKYYDSIKFPVNDILMNVGNVSGIFLPVNKHGAQAREAVKAIDKAYASDSQILYFPAGLCSRKSKGEICDLTWQKSFITKAIQHKRDIVLTYFDGRNSNRFYNIANIRKYIGLRANIEMLYLPDEMFRQRGQKLHLVFGETISWKKFDKSRTPTGWAEWVKEQCYELAGDIHETK